tara:strand:+ start:165 stop:947 length:783 start_codon:yes stop_codon:yes gene_type:complete
VTPQEYYQNFEQSVAEYNAAFDDYEARYDTFLSQLYQQGTFINPRAMGRDLLRQGSLFQTGGFTGVVMRENETKGLYAQTGEVRQAQNLVNVNTRGRFQQTFRDPVTGLTFDITNRNTNQGVEFAPNTYGFEGGTVVGITPEPTFDMQAPSFDQVKFEELLDAEAQALRDREAEIKSDNAKLEKKLQDDEARFDAEMADFRRRSDQALIQIAEDTEEIEGRIESMAEATKRETERIDRERGARRAGYVRARTLRGRPLLS